MKGTKPVCEDGDIDRISSLPRDVIDRILERLPTHDAARTCILSSTWRHIWAYSPKLVVDKKFWDTIKQKRISKKYPLDFDVETLNRMFINHIGHISELVLDTSAVRSERYYDVDLWLSFMSRSGMEVLKLENSMATSYTVPSCVFSNSDLTCLSISNCILETMKSTSLHKLRFLHLENATLSSCVLVTPLLFKLILKSCRGTNHFNISAPRLEFLTLTLNDDLNLVPYLTCSYIRYAHMDMNKTIAHHGRGKQINLMNLLSCWPKISTFILHGSSLEYLATGTLPGEFPFSSSLTQLIVSVNFTLEQIAWILHILQKSPLLHSFNIYFLKTATDDLEAENYLKGPNILNQKMEKLREVKMSYYTPSRVQLLLTKILLYIAPSLEKMLVVEEDDVNRVLTDCPRISKELMQLPRASPNAKIIFRQS